MSKPLHQLKHQLLDFKTQAISFLLNGTIVESDDCVFKLNKGDNLSTLNLFFESISFILEDEHEFPVFFPSIEITDNNKDFTVDLTINKHDTHYLMLIEDRTYWYSELRVMQQERNQRTLENEALNHRNKNLELERELLKLKNSEMQRMQNFKSDFFSKVSHELRTPISGIIGLSNLLEDVRANSKDAEKYLKSLKTSAGHLQSIVNDVLDMSKIESGKFKLNNQPMNLGELIEDVTLSFYYQAKEKGLELKSYIVNTLPTWVNADATRLKQILFNLLNNAMKFTKRGHLALHASFDEVNDKQYRIYMKIEDTGIGIEPENLDKIFGEYEQADDKTQSDFGGTGLGLSVVKNLVQLYNGAISVSSIPGEGSIFNFDLLLDKVANPNKLSILNNKLLYTKLKVLIADDDPINLMILKRLFENNTSLCTVVNDGEDVLQALAEQSYDLLISDVNMPGKTGIELAYDLEDDPIIIFLLSGEFMDENHRVFHDKVVNKAFLKPVNPQELFDAINSTF